MKVWIMTTTVSGAPEIVAVFAHRPVRKERMEAMALDPTNKEDKEMWKEIEPDINVKSFAVNKN